MNEPRLSPASRQLIDTARPAEQPGHAAKQRVHAALAAALAAPPPAPNVTTSALAGASVKIALVCTLTVAALGTTAVVMHQRAQRPVAAASESPRPVPTPASTVAVAATNSPRPAPAAEPPAPRKPPSALAPRARAEAASRPNAWGVDRPPSAAPSRLAMATSPEVAPVVEPPLPMPPRPAADLLLSPLSPQPSPGPPPPSPWTPPPAPSVARSTPLVTGQAKQHACSAREELRLLAGAQAALREHNGRTALAHLDQHLRQCPWPRFGEEESAARVLALCLLHRTDQALAEATRLAAQAPRSPQLVRLRTSCAAAAVSESGAP